jgi:hypothetical protein
MEFAKAIKAGTLELICPEMELLVCPSYHEAALRGTGVIKSDDLGRLYFRMISAFSPTALRHKSLFGSKPVGELYEPGDYVMLRAVDEYGREWRGNHLRIDLRNEIPLPNYLIRANLVSILTAQERKSIDESLVRVVIPGVPDLPFDGSTERRSRVGEREIGFSSSLDHHEHRMGGAGVVFRREEGGFVSISAVREKAFLPTWPGLMCHALGFAVGQTLTPAVIVREFDDRADLAVHSGPFWRYTSLMHSPVPFTDIRGTGDFWTLVELFLAFLEGQNADPSPLLDELEGVRRGSQGSLQTACLTLAVGIESMAKLLMGDEFSAKICRPSIEPLLTHLDAWQGDVLLKDRARGALSRLADIGAADLMYAWAEKTGTDKKLVDDWKKLRHPRAHGKNLAVESGWALYCSGAELLNRIIAHAIGYRGSILMTSQPGWGIQQ